MKKSMNLISNHVASISAIKTRKPSEISTLAIDLSKIESIKKDINLIVLPFFYFSTKGKYEVIEYNFNNDDSQKMIVKAPQGESVPSSFDYQVLQVLLKFREHIKRIHPEKEDFSCSAWDIAKELGIIYQSKTGKLSLAKKDKDRITKSIIKLKETNYELLKLYNVKELNESGEKVFYKKDRIHINILDHLEASESLFNSESLYRIKFNTHFLKSIKNKYHYSYELSKLEAITIPTARRLFEIIDFRRKQKLSGEFSYSEIAWAIPLNSGKMNRILINNYLQHLKEIAKVIKDYKPDSPKGFFQVLFIKDTQAKRNAYDESETTIPRATQMELFNFGEKSLSEEEKTIINQYVTIKKQTGEIKKSLSGYKKTLEESILNDPSILDQIKLDLETIQKNIQEQKIPEQKSQDKLNREKTIREEMKKAEEEKIYLKEILNKLNQTEQNKLYSQADHYLQLELNQYYKKNTGLGKKLLEDKVLSLIKTSSFQPNFS